MERKNGEKKGKVMKKGEEKRRGGADGEYGNRYEVFQHLILPGRQREQECGFRATWRGEVGGGLAGVTQEAKF